jgi:hypothetical protein
MEKNPCFDRFLAIPFFTIFIKITRKFPYHRIPMSMAIPNFGRFIFTFKRDIYW